MEPIMDLKERYRGRPVTGTTFNNMILDIGQLSNRETAGWTYALHQEDSESDCSNGGLREGTLHQIISDASGVVVSDVQLTLKTDGSILNSMVVAALVSILLKM